MTLLLPKVKSFGEEFGSNLGGGLGQGFSEAIMANKENKAIQKQLGLDLSGVRDPAMRQAMVADQLRYGRQRQQAKAGLGIKYSPEEEPIQKESRQDRRRLERETEEEIPYERKELPELKVKGGKARSSEIRHAEEPIKEGMGFAPQPSTEGKPFKLLNPPEIEQLGEQIAMQHQSQGIPMSKEEGIQVALQQENMKSTYNQNLELDREKKLAHQKNVGNNSVDKLLKLYPEASDEIQAIFRKKGEEAASNNVNQSDFERQIAKEATKFKNDISNLENSFPPSRLFNNIKGGLFGNSRKANEARDDIRIKMKPFLDQGLYDTMRQVLSSEKLGYAPEEREALITDLGESTKKTISQIPKLEQFQKSKKMVATGLGIPSGAFVRPNEKEFKPEQLQIVDDSLNNIFKNEPNVNMLLLRKAYEDKGVDWRTFKNQMNKMVLNGDVELNPDQLNQFNSYIDEPPLGPLSYLLEKLKLIGR